MFFVLRISLVLAMIFGSWQTPRAFAAPDDSDVAPDEHLNPEHFEVDVANFDQWVFQNSGNKDQAQDQMQKRLKAQVDEIDRVCTLQAGQKQKLLLAARGDTKRFMDEVELVRTKFMAVRQDQQAFNEIWQDINPLQMKLAKGLYGETSFFAKSLKKMLDPEQAAKYRAFIDQRNQFRHRAAVQVTVVNLSDSLTLRQEQREAIVKLLTENVPIVSAPSQYDNYIILYRLSKIAEGKIKPLLDEGQWTMLQRHLGRNQGIEEFLIRNGLVAKEEAGEAVPVQAVPAVELVPQ